MLEWCLNIGIFLKLLWYLCILSCTFLLFSSFKRICVLLMHLEKKGTSVWRRQRWDEGQISMLAIIKVYDAFSFFKCNNLCLYNFFVQINLFMYVCVSGNTALHFCFAYGYGDTLGQYLMTKGRCKNHILLRYMITAHHTTFCQLIRLHTLSDISSLISVSLSLPVSTWVYIQVRIHPYWTTLGSVATRGFR
jgi:hypothetical protein